MNGSLKGKNLLELLFLIERTESFKNIKELFKQYSVLPITSVECERVFSQVGLVKTKTRNFLHIDNLVKLIMDSQNGLKENNLILKKHLFIGRKQN